MRIIAGELKGRRLAAPRWEGLRPTSDKLRETLFNVLQGRMAGARVLDGFAGTGALGIEAISRGARHVTFVERDRRAVALIAENLRRCGVVDRYTIVRASVDDAVRRLQAERFDVILLDPPYDAAGLDATVAASGNLLTEDGVLVLEHASRKPVAQTPGGLVRERDLVSGDSALAFYVRSPAPVAGFTQAEPA